MTIHPPEDRLGCMVRQYRRPGAVSAGVSGLVILVCTVVLVSTVAHAQGTISTGGFAAFAGGTRIERSIYLGQTVTFNVTVTDLSATECNVSMSLEIEAVNASWYDRLLGQIMSGRALASNGSFHLLPDLPQNVSLTWNTAGVVHLVNNDTAETRRGEFHVEFDRGDCDGGNGPTGLVLYSAPYDFNVTCSPGDIPQPGGICSPPSEIPIWAIASAIAVLALVVIAIILYRRRRPPKALPMAAE